MSDVATSNDPIAVFGDPSADSWAVLVGGAQPRIAFGLVDAGGPGNPAGAEPTFAAVTIDRDDGQVWVIAGDGVDLKLELAGASSYTFEDGSALQPCRIMGSAIGAPANPGDHSGELASVAAKNVEKRSDVDLPGVVMAELPTGKIDSIRLISSWFPGGHEISLLSVRPKGSKGHGEDLVDVVARGEEHNVIFDPRLSTTYGPDGTPRKAGIEMWLGDEDEDDQFPRRVAAVASGVCAAGQLADFKFQAQALHCLCRGEEGSGVYVLLRGA